MIGDLIAGIMGLIKKGDFQQASGQLQKIYYDVLKEDCAFFRSIPDEEMTDRLLREHNYTGGHL